MELRMHVEKRPAGPRVRRGSPDPARAAQAKPQFHLCIPDLSGDERLAAPGPPDKPPHQPAPPRNPIDAARTKLSEKRYREGHQHVTEMIEGLRDKRRRLFKRLWTASVVLTALSVVALAVELVHRADFLSTLGDTVETNGHSTIDSSRRARRSADRSATPRKLAAPRQWTNELPAEPSVQSAVFETTGRAGQEGAWLEGKIADTDIDTDRSRSGALHDDPQPGPR
jgi:hypothetical protein